MKIDVDLRSRDPRARIPIEVDVRIECLDATDTGRLVRQVHAGAETHLEDAAARPRERARPRAAQHLARHRAVEQEREYAVVVQAHVSSR